MEDPTPELIGEDRDPADLLARVLAHLGHRLPLVHRVEKRLEGQESRSGFLSDLAALLGQLWVRNRETLAALQQTIEREKAAARPTQPVPGGNGADPVPSSEVRP